jgi:hypothetical protein
MRPRWALAFTTAALVASVATSGGVGAEPRDSLEAHTHVLGVTLERTTLADAERILGPAEARHNGGDAAASATAACYVGPDGTVLALVSNNEMGGGSKITHYELVAKNSLAAHSDEADYTVPVEKRPRCARLPSLSRATTTGGGLKLGMRVDDVRRLLGKPAEAMGREAVFESVTKVPMTPEQRETWAIRDPSAAFLGRVRSLRLDFEDRVVVAIRVAQITSY